MMEILEKNIGSWGRSFFSYYIEECQIRIFYCFWSFLSTWIVFYFYTYESLYVFLIQYGRSYIFTESGELFFQTFFFHILFSLFWTIPYGIYQFFSFINSLLIKSEKRYYMFIIFVFFFFYIFFVFLSFKLSSILFHFFLNKRIETALLSIEGSIRITSICWNIFQCFFFPFFIFGIFFLSSKGKVFLAPRFYGWILLLLCFAWMLPPDFLIQCGWSIFVIILYEIWIWICFFLYQIKE